MKIVADISIKDIDTIFPLLRGFDDASINFLETADIVNSNIVDADALLVRSHTNVNKQLLLSSNIKWIGSATAGIDHIDTNYLDTNNIIWFNAKGCNSFSVCNYVLSSLYQLKKDKIFKETDTVGIIGYGNIGKRLKNILDNLNINNIAYDPFLKSKVLSSISEIMQAEIITIHTPLTYMTKFATNNLVDTEFLEKSNSHSIINTSRGGIVSEVDILKSKQNYIADVWENEPHLKNSIMDCYIATPHIAGHSFEGKVKGTIDTLFGLMNFLNFDKNIVNKNLKLIDNLYPSSAKSYKYLKDFNDNYDIEIESNRFKDLFKNMHKNNFNKLRSSHLNRHDLSIYKI